MTTQAPPWHAPEHKCLLRTNLSNIGPTPCFPGGIRLTHICHCRGPRKRSSFLQCGERSAARMCWVFMAGTDNISLNQCLGASALSCRRGGPSGVPRDVAQDRGKRKSRKTTLIAAATGAGRESEICLHMHPLDVTQLRHMCTGAGRMLFGSLHNDRLRMASLPEAMHCDMTSSELGPIASAQCHYGYRLHLSPVSCPHIRCPPLPRAYCHVPGSWQSQTFFGLYGKQLRHSAAKEAYTRSRLSTEHARSLKRQYWLGNG